MTHIRHSGKVLFMRIFITVLVLIFSFQSWTKADDISDFEIEGMSIGDSLLDFYSKDEIDDALQVSQYPASDKFIIYTFRNVKSFETYQAVSVDVKKIDSNYKIYAISGVINYTDNMSECYLLMEKIALEFKEIFNNSKEFKVKRSKLEYDKSGKSYQRYHSFDIPNGDRASLECNDWSDEVPRLSDSIMVSLMIAEYSNFLDKEAY